MVDMHYSSKVYEKHFQIPLINPETCSVMNKIFMANLATINIFSSIPHKKKRYCCTSSATFALFCCEHDTKAMIIFF